MHYLAIFLAFLAEITLKPNFIVANFTIESITIVYFLILLSTTKKMPVIVPCILLLIANTLVGKPIGLQPIILLVTVFLCYIFVLNDHQRMYSSGKKTLSLTFASVLFAMLFFLATLVQTLALYLYGYSPNISWQVICYIINVMIFFALAICIY